MTEPFINSNNNIRYLYTLKKIINIIKSLLFECIRNLLKMIIIFSRVRYLQFCIFVKTSLINEIKYRFLLIIAFNFL